MDLLAQYLSDYKLGRGSADENVILLRATNSTNTAARGYANGFMERELEPPNAVVIALSQDAGRGRTGKTWESHYGKGVYLSILFSLQASARLEDLPVSTAVGVCRALRHWDGGRCRIKWPNDLQVAGGKVAGILIESVTQGERTTAVIGIGINCSQSADELPATAVSLRAVSLDRVALGEVAGTVVRLVIDEVAMMARSRVDTIDAYREWSAHTVGESISCSTNAGLQAGKFLGFDKRGFIKLGTAQGEITVRGGEIVES